MLHSGTVGAALTAANFGVSALAVSTGAGPDPAWETAGELAVAAVDWLLGAAGQDGAQPQRARTSRSTSSEGVRWAEPAPFGTVRATLVEVGDAGSR